MTLGKGFDHLAPAKCKKCGRSGRPYKTISSESYLSDAGAEAMVTWKCKYCGHTTKEIVPQARE